MGDSAFQRPGFDIGKFSGGFKMPTFDTTSAVEAGQKNFATLNAMSSATLNSVIAIAHRQTEMMRATVDSFVSHGTEMLAGGTFDEKAAKQIDFAKRSYASAVAYTRELAALYAKSRSEALASVHDRIAALSLEIKAAVAQKK